VFVFAFAGLDASTRITSGMSCLPTQAVCVTGRSADVAPLLAALGHPGCRSNPSGSSSVHVGETCGRRKHGAGVAIRCAAMPAAHW
jgi:hypothetical protein